MHHGEDRAQGLHRGMGGLVDEGLYVLAASTQRDAGGIE
jgi:hypothetical protein